MLTALIDADVLTYASAFSAEKTIYHVTVPGSPVRTFDNAKDRDAWMKEHELTKAMVSIRAELVIYPEAQALMVAGRKLEAVLDEMATTRYEAYLSGADNYRYAIAVTKPYKGNRTQPKPHWHASVREYYVSRGAVVVNGAEADDALGIRLTELGDEGVICSIDKDLLGVAGKHYNWDKLTKIKVSPARALRFFCQQCISGDSTDNIPGIPKFGEKKAIALVEGKTTTEAWQAVKDLYKAKFKDDAERMLTEQAQLLWIRHKRREMFTIPYFEQEYLQHGAEAKEQGSAGPVGDSPEQCGSGEGGAGSPQAQA